MAACWASLNSRQASVLVPGPAQHSLNLGDFKRWISAVDHRMAVRTDRAQVLDRIQHVGATGAGYWLDMVNLNVIGGVRSIRFQKVEAADDATPPVAP